MDVRRRRWTAALILFLAWVVTLGAMAIFSGRRPTTHNHDRVLAPR